MSAGGEPARIKASAVRGGANFRHAVQVRDHTVVVDEPLSAGGGDAGPDPQELLAVSLASCTAITIEMYAARKGWDIGHVEVDVDYTPAKRDSPTRFELVIRVADEIPDDRVQRLGAIAATCPVHRTLGGEVQFAQRIERARVAA
jgi:putative redox protein